MISSLTNRVLSVVAIALIALSCKETGSSQERLPILGRYEVTDRGDTVHHRIQDFALVDQDSARITNENFKNQIYIADFFFTSCPDICPKMKTQMLRVYEKFKDDDRVAILSHTIDPKRDTPQALKDFSEQLEVDNRKWKFVTGDKDSIYKLGQTSYMASMAEGGESGFIHSGRFFLVDQNRHIRGAYDGTDPEDVDYLILDIKRLLSER